MSDKTSEYVNMWLDKANNDLKNDDFYMPTRQEADEAFALATEIKEFITARLVNNFNDAS